MSKKTPRPRNAGKKPEELPVYDFIQYCARLLKKRVAAGVYRDRPGLEAAILDFDPAIMLIEIAADPANTVDLRAPAAAKLLPYWHREQSLIAKLDGPSGADHNITIVVQPWAAQKRPALPSPDDARGAPVEIIEHKSGGRIFKYANGDEEFVV